MAIFHCYVSSPEGTCLVQDRLGAGNISLLGMVTTIKINPSSGSSKDMFFENKAVGRILLKSKHQRVYPISPNHARAVVYYQHVYIIFPYIL